MAAGSLTIKVKDQEMKFAVDPKTVIEAKGAGTKSRTAQASGKPGPKLDEVLKVGQGVAVTYHETNGTMYASLVRTISSVGDGGSVTSEAETMTSIGTVQSMSANTITIAGGGGSGSTFTQTFVIDEHTKVFAKGAGTAAAARGGRLPFAEIVTSGDRVSVSYHKVGDRLHASDVRVTTKAMH